MSRSPGYAIAAVILGIMLHRHSVDKVFEAVFKISPYKNAKSILIIVLVLIAIFSYFKRLYFTIFLLLNLASILLYVVISLVTSKSIDKQE